MKEYSVLKQKEIQILLSCLFTYHVKAQITTLVSYVNALTNYMKS